jgi:hypothetical protein
MNRASGVRHQRGEARAVEPAVRGSGELIALSAAGREEADAARPERLFTGRGKRNGRSLPPANDGGSEPGHARRQQRHHHRGPGSVRNDANAYAMVAATAPPHARSATACADARTAPAD